MIIIIIIIISAHKSDLSYPWSQTQASLSIPSLHPKNTNKRREREEKNNRRENLPRSDRRGREKIKQEQKNKSKDPPRISERQIDKQARHKNAIFAVTGSGVGRWPQPRYCTVPMVKSFCLGKANRYNSQKGVRYVSLRLLDL